MQTNFTPSQFRNPDVAASEAILANASIAVSAPQRARPISSSATNSQPPRPHLPDQGDARERPSGRRQDRPAHRPLPLVPFVHDDLPSGVHYMHLVDHARAHIEKTYKRPLPERALRNLLAFILPRPALFRLALFGAWFAKPFAGLFPGRLKGLVAMAPAAIPSPSIADRPGVLRRRPTPHARCPDDRLRPEGSRPQHQRSNRPASHPPGLRGRRRQRGRLLWCPHPSHGQDGCLPRLGGSQHPRLDGGSRRATASTIS